METVTIMDDAIRLHGILEWAGEAPGPLVLCLHGFTSESGRAHNVAACEAMREAGFSTLRLDLYGHGKSGGAFRNHTLHKWISNTLAAAAFARGLDRVTELWLSGHSQGGLTAALVGGMMPDVVRGLILRAPAFMIPEGAREGNLLGQRFDPARIPDEFPTIKGLTLSGDYLRVAQTVYPEPAIRRFPGPALILQGERDDVVPPETARRAAALYARCRLVLLPGETHHFDVCQERMRAEIRCWLTELRERKN